MATRPQPEPLIGARAAIGLLAFMRELGCNPEPLLSKVQLAAQAIDDPNSLLPLRSFVQLLELAAQASGDDCFGAHFAARYPIRYTGLAGYATLSSATIGSGCGAIARYYALLADATELSLGSQGKSARLSYTLSDASIWPRRQDAECMISVLLRWLRESLGVAWAPDEIWFEHTRPSSTRELTRLFKCKLRFGKPYNALFFPRPLLDRPLPAEHADLASLIEPYLEELLRKKNRAPDLSEAVRQLVKGTLGDGSASLSQVARKQGVGPRTLQRRLREGGQSYQELLDRTRHESSLAYLADRTLSIGQVASKLGYADVTTFNRAFRRWTGQAPSHYRRAAVRASAGSES